MKRDDDRCDRAAVLARRAALIASALSGIGVAGSAAAQQVAPSGECPAPDPKSLPRADPAFRAGRTLAEQGDFAGAAALFEESYRAVPTEQAAVMWMTTLAKLGEPQRAADVAALDLACHEDRPKVKEALAEIQASSARIEVEAAPNMVVELDDAAFPADRLKKGVLVSPGRHVLKSRAPGTPVTERQFEVAAGMTMHQVVDMPNTSIVPCLEPPIRPDRRSAVRLDAGVIAPLVAASVSDPPAPLGGGGVRVAIGAWLDDKWWFDGDLFGVALFNDPERVVLAGTSAGIRYQINGPFGLGAGASAGALFDATAEEERGALRSSAFFGPYIAPFIAEFRLVKLETRIPCWISKTSDGGVEAYRVSLVAPYLSLSFGGGVSDKRAGPAED